MTVAILETGFEKGGKSPALFRVTSTRSFVWLIEPLWPAAGSWLGVLHDRPEREVQRDPCGVSGWGPGDTAAWRVERTRADPKLEVRRGGAMTIPQLHSCSPAIIPCIFTSLLLGVLLRTSGQIPGTGRQVESQLRIFRKQVRGLSVGQAGSKWSKTVKARPVWLPRSSRRDRTLGSCYTTLCSGPAPQVLTRGNEWEES